MPLQFLAPKLANTVLGEITRPLCDSVSFSENRDKNIPVLGLWYKCKFTGIKSVSPVKLVDSLSKGRLHGCQPCNLGIKFSRGMEGIPLLSDSR